MNLKPTEEQENIIEAGIAGYNLSINAYAGCSKTTTCMLIAEKVRKPSLYIAFNKSIAEEADSKFTRAKSFHVESRTLHSIAYEHIIKPDFNFRKKLQFWFDKSDIDVGVYRGSKEEHYIKNNIIKAVIEFCQSDSYSLEAFINNHETYNGLYDLVLKFWESLIDSKSNTKITPDIYMKLFHLSEPRLGTSLIYLDEFQDSNPVTIDIVLQQLKYGTQVILVGDKYQAIYEWRGAVNGFDYVTKEFKQFYLTKSFRLNSSVANVANSLLSITGETIPLEGGNTSEVSKQPSKAVLCKGNATILSYLLGAEQEGKKVYCLADLKDLWSKMYHISNLYYGNFNKFPNAELTRFKNYEQLKAEAEYDDNLNRLVKLTIALSNGGLHANINKIKSVLVETEEEADFTISTIHKSKGLEWDIVNIADDIIVIDYEDEEELVDYLVTGQMLNVMYVAVTRARYVVNMPDKLREVVAWANNLKPLYMEKVNAHSK
jgi:hypothetical protein